MAARIDLTTALAIAAVVGAAAFAIGRTTSGGSASAASAATIAQASPDLPPSNPPASRAQGLPPSHPPVDEGMPGGHAGMPPGHPPTAAEGNAATGMPPGHPPTGAEGSGATVELAWTAPPRWELVPSTSSMRLATYRVPRAAGDADDAELTVMQAGGSLDANIDRWAGQFGDDGKRTLKRATKQIAGLDVTTVEIEGTYDGGMRREAGPMKGAALLGAIVATPGGAHFFKMVGPARSVKAARQELEELVASLRLR